MTSISKLVTLRTRIQDLIQPQLFDRIDQLSALESRDDPVFEAEWLRIHVKMTTVEVDHPLPNDVELVIREIERAAFDAVYSIIDLSDFTEFAPLISDDFGLIARAIHYGLRDDWLSGLLATYLQGEFPSGPVLSSDRSLEELIVRFG